MSRAFVKEQDGGGEPLPDRTISPFPNLVTREGLALIEAQLERLREEQMLAVDDRDKLGLIARDLRYWQARRASAEVVPPHDNPREVVFAATVTIRRNGREQTFRIVGEDEADPAHGTLSYVSPLARELIGKGVGEFAQVGDTEAEIFCDPLNSMRVQDREIVGFGE